MGLQVACLCQRSDWQSPTLNTPQPDCLCSGLLCSLSTVQQPAHHFWLVFVCIISPLIPNAILTPLSVSELCLVRHSLVSVQFVLVLRIVRLVRCNTTQYGFDSRSSLNRSDQSPISLHPLFSSIKEMSDSGQTKTKESLHFKG